MTTFYMVEMHYPPSEDRATFDRFYYNHITMLLTIDGFLSAQRYETVHPARAPFLAVYRLREPGVMTSTNYTSKAGRSSVSPTFREKMTNWDRNLVEGDIDTMNVPEGGCIVLIDRLTPDSPPLPDGFTPLKVIGLDSTIVQRGVQIIPNGVSTLHEKPVKNWTIRTLKPIHPPRSPA